MTTTRRRGGQVVGRVKLHDVAAAAGVSAQTVSRVVRNSPGVAEETRQRVMSVVRTLGYRPNLAARSLSTGRIGSVHVVVSTQLFHGTSRAFIAICRALADRGLATSTSVATPESTAGDIVPVTADGVIVLGGTMTPQPWLAEIVRRVPAVFVGQIDGLPDGVSGIMVDQTSGARLAMNRLIERGARRLVHLAGPLDWVDARLRREGFKAAAREHGLPCEIVECSSWDASSALELGDALPFDVDGVFAANDHLALGYMTACHQRGVRIPEDVAVIGVDDTAGADAYLPPLTTLRQGFSSMGGLAVETLERRLQGEPATHTLLQPTLIPRMSA